MIYTLTLNPSLDLYTALRSFQVGYENQAQQFSFVPGGKGINVSLVLKNLGIATVAWGLAGDFSGQKLIDLLNDRHLDNDFVRIQDTTRINLKIQSPQATAINFAGPRISSGEENALFARLDDIKDEDLVVMSGSLAANLPKNFYYQFAKRVKEKGTEFVLDTAGEELKAGLAAAPLLVKPNRTELAETLHRSFSSLSDYLAGGQELLQAGAKNVIISLGKEGAIFFHKKSAWFAPAALGTAVNAVGAGDSMVAGFLAYYKTGHDLLTSFKMAVAAGCAAAFTQNLPVKSQIDTLFPQIKLRQLQ